MRPSMRPVHAPVKRTSALLTAALLGACSMAPKYVQPASPVPQTWPDGEAYRDTVSAAPRPLNYAEVFEDPALQQLIAQALDNNRNLRVAAANITAARAQVKVTRANQFPALATTASATHQETGGGFGLNGWSYALRAGVSNFELDLFGRLKNATAAQINTALSTEAAARTVQLGLVADIAQGWATYAADRELLRIAEDTARSAGESVRLTQARLEGGIAARSELRQAQQVLETARSDLAAQKTALAQDVNALRLLVGADFDENALPSSITRVNAALAEVPTSADTTVLLSRPDVLEAEYSLRAANANIGVARAQLFPTISLSALTGFAAQSLSRLFDEASRSTSYGGNGEWSIFNAGGRSANVGVAKAQRDAALATYEGAIQTAFRETADTLADQGTIAERLNAATNFTEVSADNARLVEATYRQGMASSLENLDAQRSLYAARQAEVGMRLAGAVNRITLYRVLGGEWVSQPRPDETAN
ncbi:efflux transporter outer membrane subunit [Novosphingobium sp. BW1]|uniref:efflux transporter outer membrane subunit n=1 Tax=Novosphingobium sp. BW1 TaxID=2592621 RepID=UPI001F072F7E|nr:efflux transporter outer membrane subunit [Novosphingobium sp. BW1]